MTKEKVDRGKAVTGSKVEDLLVKNARLLCGVLASLVVVALVAVVAVSLRAKSVGDALGSIYEISYVLTSDNEGASREDIDKKKGEALSKLEAYRLKSGIVGVRANLLSAEICFSSDDYKKALEYYGAVVSGDEKAYTASIALYNGAVCKEELGDKSGARDDYKKVAENKDFYLHTHAAFNVGRLSESLGEYKEALSAYNAMFDDDPLDPYAVLAHNRVLYIETNKLE